MRKLLSPVFFVILIAFIPMSTFAQECANRKADWIFCEDFEGTNFLSQWGEVSHKDRKIRETNPSHVFQGKSSLKLVFPAMNNDGGGWMHYWWQPATNQGELYLRWYVKYSAGFNFGNWDVKMAGLEAHLPNVKYRPGAGYVPDGTWFQSRAVTLGVADLRGPQGPKEPFIYYYHPDQRSDWGSFGYQNISPQIALKDNQWTCIELWVKPNTVTGSSGSYSGLYDGEQALWVDGVKKAHYSGIRWRMHPDVRINDLYHSSWVGKPLNSSTQYRWEDNIVISRTKIGCLSQDTNQDITAPNAPSNLVVR